MISLPASHVYNEDMIPNKYVTLDSPFAGLLKICSSVLIVTNLFQWIYENAPINAVGSFLINKSIL